MIESCAACAHYDNGVCHNDYSPNYLEEVAPGDSCECYAPSKGGDDDAGSR